MDEVSSRMFRFYVDLASLNGIPAEWLTHGMPHAAELLASRRKWLDWDEYLMLVERFETLMGGPLAAEDAFRDGTFRQVVRPFNAVVSYLTTARAVYWAGARWFSPSLYRHLEFEVEDLDEQSLALTVVVPAPHTESETFFRHWRGSMRFAPLQIGLPEAQVELVQTGRRAVYRIVLPERRKVMGRLRSWARAVLNSSDVVDEISRHQIELREAYEALLEKHRLAEAALRQSEQTQRVLLEALPDLLLVLGTDGTIHDVKGARHPLSSAAQKRVGMPLERLIATLEDTPSGLTETLVEHARDAHRMAKPQYFEFSVSQGGQRLHFEWRTTAVEPGRVLCVVRDNSDRKRLESQLLLSDRMASLGSLAAAVAHEVNNPLAAMLNNLEVLRRVREGEREFQLHDPLVDAMEAGLQIREIVGQLRIFTRVDGEELKPIDVNGLIDSMLRMTAHRVKHSATVVRSFGKVPLARADQARLGQVIVNLLVNAVQAMPDSNVAHNRIHVKTSATAEDRVQIEIRDTGQGIPQENLGRIFDPFFTTKSFNEGTGLGLAICQRIVTDLGGTIEVESEQGNGSTFRVTLPAAEPVQPRAVVKSFPVPLESGVRRRVLVVDDNPRLGLTLKMLLRDHDVTVVQHGSEAVTQLLSNRYEIALCDLMMPEVDGIEVYRRVREANPGLESRIVFMTGGAFTPEARTFLGSISNRCLQKPFRPDELERLIAAGP